MDLRAGIDNNGAKIEALRLAVVSQRARVRFILAAVYPSPEAKLLVAMEQNLEILMMNRSIETSQGAPE